MVTVTFDETAALKEAVLMAFLPTAGKEGWSEAALVQACEHVISEVKHFKPRRGRKPKEGKETPQARKRSTSKPREQILAEALEGVGTDDAATLAWTLYPGGAAEAAELWSRVLNQQMIDGCIELDFPSLKVRERVFWAVRTRFELMAPEKDAAKALSKFLASPRQATLALRLATATVHEVWVCAGDTATDYNFYTKRVLLMVVYSATLVYWLRDTSRQHTKTWIFLERRINDVLKLQRVKSTLTGACEMGKGALQSVFQRFGL